jgi:hypothetical protein
MTRNAIKVINVQAQHHFFERRGFSPTNSKAFFS